MAVSPYDDSMQSIYGEDYLYPDFYFQSGKTPKDDEWDEFLRIEGIKKDRESFYPDILDDWTSLI